MPTPLIGRDAERADLAARLDAGVRLIGLTGTAGIGKSRLAADLAAAHAGLVCALAATRDEAGVLDAVGRTLGLSPSPAPADAVLRALTALTGPLVLDDADYVLPILARLLQEWLQRAPSATFVVTSRDRLRIDDEVVVDIAPLTAPAATALFVARARSAAATVAADAPALAGLIAALEGIPLALELAASRVELLGLDGIASRLSKRLDLLAHGRRGADSRTATMRGAIAVSFDLLDGPEREAMAALAVIDGDFGLDLAEAVLGGPALDRIQSLRERSLLRVVAPGRLALYRAVQEYAREGVSDASVPLSRAAAWLVDQAEAETRAAERRGGRPDRCIAERATLVGALDRALAARNRAIAVPLALGLAATGPYAPNPAALLERLDRCIAVAQDDPRLRRARGRARRIAGDLDGAETDLRTALASCEDEERRADVLQDLGLVAHQRRDIEIARAMYLQALPLYEAAGHERGAAITVGNLGALHHDVCEHDAAIESYERALTALRRLGDGRVEGIFLCNVGVLYQEQGRRDVALRRYGRALELVRASGDRQFEAIVLGNLGILRLASGDLDGAIRDLDAALTLQTAYGGPRGEALAHARLAGALAMAGDLDGAEQRITDAEAKASVLQDPVARGVVELHLGFLAAARRDTEAVAARLRAARREPPGARALVEVSDDARTAVALIESMLADDTRDALEIDATGERFRPPGGSWQDVAPYRSSALLFRCLVAARIAAPGRGVDLDALFAAGWPGETISPESAANRVYVALARLRRMGLRDALLRNDAGWFLDPARPIRTA